MYTLKIIEDALNKIKPKYSKFIHDLISQMLNADIKERPDFIDIACFLKIPNIIRFDLSMDELKL